MGTAFITKLAFSGLPVPVMDIGIDCRLLRHLCAAHCTLITLQPFGGAGGFLHGKDNGALTGGPFMGFAFPEAAYPAFAGLLIERMRAQVSADRTFTRSGIKRCVPVFGMGTGRFAADAFPGFAVPYMPGRGDLLRHRRTADGTSVAYFPVLRTAGLFHRLISGRAGMLPFPAQFLPLADLIYVSAVRTAGGAFHIAVAIRTFCHAAAGCSRFFVRFCLVSLTGIRCGTVRFTDRALPIHASRCTFDRTAACIRTLLGCRRLLTLALVQIRIPGIAEKTGFRFLSVGTFHCAGAFRIRTPLFRTVIIFFPGNRIAGHCPSRRIL